MTVKGDGGELIILPGNDTLFATGYPIDGSGEYIDMVIAEPGEMIPGSVHPEFIGKTTSDVNTIVRIRMTPEVCAIMIERIVSIQLQLMGLPVPGWNMLSRERGGK